MLTNPTDIHGKNIVFILIVPIQPNCIQDWLISKIFDLIPRHLYDLIRMIFCYITDVHQVDPLRCECQNLRLHTRLNIVTSSYNEEINKGFQPCLFLKAIRKFFCPSMRQVERNDAICFSVANSIIAPMMLPP